MTDACYLHPPETVDMVVANLNKRISTIAEPLQSPYAATGPTAAAPDTPTDCKKNRSVEQRPLAPIAVL